MKQLLEAIKNTYTGSIIVNGTKYANVAAALDSLQAFEGTLTVLLNKEAESSKNSVTRSDNPIVTASVTADIYQIKVRRYMTQPASPEFDFHTKWNNGNPMPMRIMVGKVLEETRGMVKMELWAEITDEITTHCMKCGKALTNEVSKYFGIGPECGGHNYTNPFSTKEELKAAVAIMKQQLQEVRWTGWVIKTAIEEETVIRKEVQ